MQRLPYNGAPRAHKLRHNVISSSLFNERQQRAAHTFYPVVFVVSRRPYELTLSLSLTRCSLRKPHQRPNRPPRELVASCARCVVKSVLNVIHLLIEPIVRVPILLDPRFVDRDIISSVRTRVTALPIIISLLRAIHIIRDGRICIRDQTRPSLRQRSSRYQFLRITASTRDLMRSILPPVKPNILHTRTSLSRNWRIYKPLVVGNVMNFNETRGYKRGDATRCVPTYQFWQDF